MKKIIQSFLQKTRVKKYVAMMPLEREHLCAAVHASKNDIYFLGFQQAPLTTLAQMYRHYALSLRIPKEAIVSKTWVLPNHLSLVEIYPHIAKQSLSKNYASFDIEHMGYHEESQKQIVVAHFLTRAYAQILSKTYDKLNFQFHQLVPAFTLDKMLIQSPWQEEALKNNENMNTHLNETEGLLKLLHQAIYHEYHFY